MLRFCADRVGLGIACPVTLQRKIRECSQSNAMREGKSVNSVCKNSGMRVADAFYGC